MENQTLWLPAGYGKGTIIYDLDNIPFEAVENVGGGIFSIQEVEKKYAESRIAQGAKVLTSTPKT